MDLNLLNMKNLIISYFFIIWGEEYIECFTNNCLNYLINSNFHSNKDLEKNQN